MKHKKWAAAIIQLPTSSFPCRYKALLLALFMVLALLYHHQMVFLALIRR